MNKIGEINKRNANPLLCAITGILLTITMAFIIFKIKPFDIVEYITNKDKVIEIILLLPIQIVCVIIHELIHISFFIYFGKGEAKIKLKREKEYGALVVHQMNENVYYSKKEIIIILLSPLLIITILLIPLMDLINMPFLIFANSVLNILGSSIDFYISMILLRKTPKNIKVNFSSSEIAMNIYEY